MDALQSLLSLHLPKRQIVGNHMSRLKSALEYAIGIKLPYGIRECVFTRHGRDIRRFCLVIISVSVVRQRSKDCDFLSILCLISGGKSPSPVLIAFLINPSSHVA